MVMRVLVAGGTGVLGRRRGTDHLLAGEVTVTMMTEGRGFSDVKAKRELRYPSWRQGFKDGLV